MDALKKHFQDGDQFAARNGIELVTLEPGHAVTRMVVQPWHHNAVGIVQGGVVFTLADFAFGAASNSDGTVALGVNMSVTFLKATRSGTLTADAREIGGSSKLGSYTINVTDDSGQLVAVMQGLAYRKKETHPLPHAR